MHCEIHIAALMNNARYKDMIIWDIIVLPQDEYHITQWLRTTCFSTAVEIKKSITTLGNCLLNILR